jgi:dipeptidase E
MKVILTGGGSGDNTKELDKKFSSLLDKSKPLLYIPLAIDNIKHPYSECLKWLRLTFDNLGVSKYEMWTGDKLENSENKNPKDFAGIYIGGGNTPYLLKKIRETGFDKFIEKALSNNVPIYGGSAGAVIFAKTIIPSLYHDMNWVDLKNFEGFNQINNLEITCHYDSSQDDQIKKMISDNKMPKVLALTEKNGIFVSAEKLELIGQERAFLFEKGSKKEINLGEVNL